MTSVTQVKNFLYSVWTKADETCCILKFVSSNKF